MLSHNRNVISPKMISVEIGGNVKYITVRLNHSINYPLGQEQTQA